jgi:hypothetical protein
VGERTTEDDDDEEDSEKGDKSLFSSPSFSKLLLFLPV